METSSSSSVSGPSRLRFFAVGFDVRPALVVVVGGTTGEAAGDAFTGRGVLADTGGSGVLAGAFSVTGVEGWLFDGNLILILRLPSVGVAGTAGGGMAAECNGALAEGGMAPERGKYDVGEIPSGVATAWLKKEAL